ncbi:MAG: diacylglycerol/lipid kinase family protein [Candidatus Nanopelagicales bacterium]
MTPAAPPPRKIALLVNPTSGNGSGRIAAGDVTSALSAGGAQVLVVQGSTAADAAAELQVVVAAGVDAIVAAGGDGTVNLALQAAVNTPLALGIVPLGSGNDSARELGIVRGDPRAAVETILAGRRRRIDAGLVTTAEGDSRYYLNVLSSGFDSSVNERANATRWPRGHAKYLRALLSELVTFRAVPYEVAIDGLELEGRAMLIAVGNTRSYGGGMLICPTADPADGLLDLLWLTDVTKLDFLRTFPKVFRGRHLSHPAVSAHQGRRFQLRAPGQVAYVDGERVGPLPVTVEVAPGALEVLVPC